VSPARRPLALLLVAAAALIACTKSPDPGLLEGQWLEEHFAHTTRLDGTLWHESEEDIDQDLSKGFVIGREGENYSITFLEEWERKPRPLQVQEGRLLSPERSIHNIKEWTIESLTQERLVLSAHILTNDYHLPAFTGADLSLAHYYEESARLTLVRRAE